MAVPFPGSEKQVIGFFRLINFSWFCKFFSWTELFGKCILRGRNEKKKFPPIAISKKYLVHLTDLSFPFESMKFYFFSMHCRYRYTMNMPIPIKYVTIWMLNAGTRHVNYQSVFRFFVVARIIRAINYHMMYLKKEKENRLWCDFIREVRECLWCWT